MSATTSRGYRYATSGDAPRIDTISQNLASDVNTDVGAIATRVTALEGRAGCLLEATVVQAIANGGANLTFTGADVYDNASMHNPAVNPTRITVPTTGLYQVFAQVGFAANANGARELGFRISGSADTRWLQRGPASGTANGYIATAGPLYLTAGQHVEAVFNQTSGGALNTVTAPSGTIYAAFAVTLH